MLHFRSLFDIIIYPSTKLLEFQSFNISNTNFPQQNLNFPIIIITVQKQNKDILYIVYHHVDKNLCLKYDLEYYDQLLSSKYNSIWFKTKIEKWIHKNYLVYHQHPKGSNHNFVQAPTQKQSQINYSLPQQYPTNNLKSLTHPIALLIYPIKICIHWTQQTSQKYNIKLFQSL